MSKKCRIREKSSEFWRKLKHWGVEKIQANWIVEKKIARKILKFRKYQENSKIGKNLGG